MPTFSPLPIAYILILATPVGAEAFVDLRVTAYDDGGQFYFLVDGKEVRNPGLAFQPGQTVRVNLTNNGTVPHNFRITGLSAGAPEGIACCIAPGQSADATFTVPSIASTLGYLCDLHPELGMEGTIQVGGQSNPTPAPGLMAIGAALFGTMLGYRLALPRKPGD